MGRYCYTNRRLVEYAFKVSLSYLTHAGVFKQPCTADSSGTIYETRNRERTTLAVYSYIVTVTPSAASIAFRHTYQGKDYQDTHKIEKQAVHLGGFRYFFRCRHCSRQVKFLFFGGNAWGCRHCCRLVYESSRESRTVYGIKSAAERAYRRADELKRRAHPRLAKRMIERGIDLEILHERTWTAEAQRRFGV